MRKSEIEKNNILSLNESFYKSMSVEISDKMMMKTFVLPLKIDKVENNVVFFSSSLSKDILNVLSRTPIHDKILKVLADIVGQNVSYNIIDKTLKKNSQKELEIEKQQELIRKSISKNLRKKTNDFSREYTFETYVEGKFNSEALRMARAVLEGEREYNPIFMTANSGLGKTHLLHALGNELQKQNSDVIYINPPDFSPEISILLQENNPKKIKQRVDELLQADVLMFDDFQYYGQGNKKSTLQIINQVLDQRMKDRKLTIFCSDKSINALNSTFDQRLITRLTAGLQVQIKAPKNEDLLKILDYYIEVKKLNPDKWEETAKEFVTRNFSSSIRNLIGAIGRLSWYKEDIASKTNGRYTESILKNILQSIASNNERVTTDSIIDHVAKYYKISKKDILGKSRQKNVVLARHMAIYIIRDEMNIPLEKIGQIFGNRDHSTILNALKKIETLKEQSDQSCDRAISEIMDSLYKLA
ncbi:chromosomal replication initiation protein DnaA [Mycoplasmopsis californica]|uniref:Chromosomal replication initiator protein DnaA n=1 Tax=Mycoplasmopsis californica TaxID=2113 RepID=A0A059XKZ6_9BACT|nr:chromosomal replication initiator protein DnaA [Mycoplasmopsis californica]AIA29184.1 chromosomal replication initiation protein DnaA [Mycoplasmopsis californica]